MAQKKKRAKLPSRRRMDPALQLAITAAGGQARLAEAVGITPQALNQWRKCPPRRAVAVERATGGVVRRERLCPEIYEPA